MENNIPESPGSLISPDGGGTPGAASSPSTQPQPIIQPQANVYAAVNTYPGASSPQNYRLSDPNYSDTVSPSTDTQNFFAEHSSEEGAGSYSSYNSQQSPSPVTAGSKTYPKVWKQLIVVLVLLVVLVGGAEAFYFGYYLNPGVVYKAALVNTGKGYSNLISYSNSQLSTRYSGAKITGSAKLTTSGVNITGSFNEQYSASASTTSFKTSFLGHNLDFEARSIIPPSATTPNIYLQLSGISALNLGSDLGVSNAQINKLDGQWIVIDHSILDQLKSDISQLQQSTNNTQALTHQDIIAAAQEFGTINNQYVFTSNKANSVTTILKNYGTQTIDGRKTIHYKIGFVKQNVKNYITALRNGLQSSTLGKWLVSESGTDINDLIDYNGLEAGANNINSSDTIDVWADTGSRLIYKVRISAPGSDNPALNYIDIGLNYKKGSSSYPFFINYEAQSDGDKLSAEITATIDTKNNSYSGVVNVSNQTGQLFNLNLGFQPTNTPLNLTAPTNTITIQAALADLGLSSYYTEFINAIDNPNSVINGGTGSPSSNALFGIVQYL